LLLVTVQAKAAMSPECASSPKCRFTAECLTHPRKTFIEEAGPTNTKELKDPKDEFAAAALCDAAWMFHDVNAQLRVEQKLTQKHDSPNLR
jgi:hypothetical protein